MSTSQCVCVIVTDNRFLVQLVGRYHKCQCNVNAMSMQCQCNVNAMSIQCQYNVNTMSIQCQRRPNVNTSEVEKI